MDDILTVIIDKCYLKELLMLRLVCKKLLKLVYDYGTDMINFVDNMKSEYLIKCIKNIKFCIKDDDDNLSINCFNLIKNNIYQCTLSNYSYIRNNDLINLLNLKKIHIESTSTNIVTDCDLIGLHNLNKLTLKNNNQITDFSIKTLTNLTSLKIMGIEVINNKITNNGISVLTNLTELDLYNNNRITDDGIKNCKKLIKLTCNCNITKKSINKLTNLIYLDLGGNYDVENEDIEQLTKLRELYTSNNLKVNTNNLSNNMINQHLHDYSI